MAKPEYTMDALGLPVLGAADLRHLAGLSYRQLNDWEDRGALRSTRQGKQGWRRVSPLQAMALRIAAHIRDKYGIPLSQLRGLISWMLGYAPTPHEQALLAIAESRAFPSPLRRPTEDVLSALKEELQSSDVAALETCSDSGEPAAAAAIRVLASKLLPGLRRRGWDDNTALAFAVRFLSLSIPEPYGEVELSEVVALQKMAASADDRGAVSAVGLLGAALLPLWSALQGMATGFPVFLTFDAKSSMFVTESELLELTRMGGVEDGWLVVRVSEHVNAVFEAVGREPMPVTTRTADVETELHGADEATTDAVLQLLRDGDVERVIVEKAPSGYRLVYEHQRDARDLEEIEALLAQHDYQTLTIKKHDGRITRVTQTPSAVVRDEPRERTQAERDSDS